MEGEAGVLQDGVQALPIRCRRPDPVKGVGSRQDEGEKAHPDQGEHSLYTGVQH